MRKMRMKNSMYISWNKHLPVVRGLLSVVCSLLEMFKAEFVVKCAHHGGR